MHILNSNLRTIVLYFIVLYCISDNSIANAKDSHLSNILYFCSLHCKLHFQSPQTLFADGLILLFVPYSARYPSSLYSTSNIFHTDIADTLNCFWDSSAFKTRPSAQYCEAISTVNEKVNVTYKMSINLMSLHFNGTLTQRRIKLLPRDQPNHLAPQWNHPQMSQQMQKMTCQ